ncbi:protein of unknown function DUF1684 [Emticicia oligotrophica DSM 17448]|jgi:uncharacterized protein (DUF1684 family)|uniref:DUF1684 domain-containing protein n=1 Tax=Emticicia oligotrophica (strain DSM 17448 / CIP 109782 / MTCC 6937 / GPTSA100-15) TaxID=929562 RepID=A0ABM5N1N5_EMTOG|nr:DUF1684 domain-containing protein [Emticicia oligotrophica]AFK03275.1 protein of unknown function DUF1684 [Emticicia oligotrophica DSM 17448]
MKAFFLVACCGLFCSTLFAQDFKAEIEKHREEYKTEFLKDSNSPLKKEDLEYLRFFEPNEKYKVLCEFVLTKKKEKPFDIPTSSGQTATYTKFGELKFEIDGKPYKVAVYQSLRLRNLPQYRDYLFIPFKDLTNGKESYGGGRYLDLRMSQLEGDKIYLDFNKAYNPYCAFSAGYSCPIPPKENHLKVAIEAGEKNFAKEH